MRPPDAPSESKLKGLHMGAIEAQLNDELARILGIPVLCLETDEGSLELKAGAECMYCDGISSEVWLEAAWLVKDINGGIPWPTAPQGISAYQYAAQRQRQSSSVFKAKAQSMGLRASAECWMACAGGQWRHWWAMASHKTLAYQISAWVRCRICRKQPESRLLAIRSRSTQCSLTRTLSRAAKRW